MPERSAISYLDDSVMIEREEQSREVYALKLAELLRGIREVDDVQLKYLNGPFAQTQLALNKPKSNVDRWRV